MVPLLDAIELETKPNPTAAIIWLHGLGASGHDFVPIVPQLNLSIGVRFIFPHALMQPVSINGGYVMPAWYDIAHPDLSQIEDEAGIRASQEKIGQLIAREKLRGIASEKIVLAGFSQGGAIALQTGLRYPEKLAGIMALSTYLPLVMSVKQEAHRANARIPIFMAHGKMDPIVPLVLAIRSRDILQSHAYTVEWHEYWMPHSVCPEEVIDIGKWLKEVLSAER